MANMDINDYEVRQENTIMVNNDIFILTINRYNCASDCMYFLKYNLVSREPGQSGFIFTFGLSGLICSEISAVYCIVT